MSTDVIWLSGYGPLFFKNRHNAIDALGHGTLFSLTFIYRSKERRDRKRNQQHQRMSNLFYPNKCLLQLALGTIPIKS